ncbi:MAG: site-specific integrase [Chloroflexales bacterium]
MDVREGCAGFLESRRIGGAKPNTMRVHKMWFDLWQIWRGDRATAVAAVDVAELRTFMAYLRDEYEAKARNTRLEWASSGRLGAHSLRSAWRSLRALWTWLAEEGALTDGQRTFFPKRIPCPKVEELPRPVYSQAMFDALLAAAMADPSAMTARHVAMLTLLAQSGMRASEVCGMRLSRLAAAHDAAQVRRKGGAWAWVTWGEAATVALNAWLALRPPTEHDYVFVALAPHTHHAPMTYNALRLSVERLAERARVELPAGASLHALRHWFAHQMLDAGVDGLHLQQMLAHTDIRTTMRYVREHPDHLREIQQAAIRRWKQPKG